MPASNTKIKKICEWCGTRFEAQKNKYKVLLSQVCKFSLQKKEREKTLRLLKRILKIGLKNYL